MPSERGSSASTDRPSRPGSSAEALDVDQTPDVLLGAARAQSGHAGGRSAAASGASGDRPTRARHVAARPRHDPIPHPTHPNRGDPQPRPYPSGPACHVGAAHHSEDRRPHPAPARLDPTDTRHETDHPKLPRTAHHPSSLGGRCRDDRPDLSTGRRRTRPSATDHHPRKAIGASDAYLAQHPRVGAALVVLTAGSPTPRRCGGSSRFAQREGQPRAGYHRYLRVRWSQIPSKTVLVLDVNPLAGVMSGTRFATDADTASTSTGPATPSPTTCYTVTFREAVRAASSCSRSEEWLDRATARPAMPTTAAAPRSAPAFVRSVLLRPRRASSRTRSRTGGGDGPRTTPTDFLTGSTSSTPPIVISIVLEIPRQHRRVGTSTNNGGHYGRRAIVDQMGRPAINTVFITHSAGTTKGPVQPDRAVGRRATGGQFRPSAGLLPGLRECGLARLQPAGRDHRAAPSDALARTCHR